MRMLVQIAGELEEMEIETTGLKTIRDVRLLICSRTVSLFHNDKKRVCSVVHLHVNPLPAASVLQMTTGDVHCVAVLGTIHSEVGNCRSQFMKNTSCHGE
eukprot:6186296-Pleurochrysis_carterae.AAC.2